MSKSQKQDEGRFAYEGLDRTLHERARLAIMTSLMSNPDGLLFNDLKTLCDLSDGNLSRHLSVLEEEGLLEREKQNESGPGRSQTLYRITEEGSCRYDQYMEELEQLMDDAQRAPEEEQNNNEATDGNTPSYSPAT